MGRYSLDKDKIKVLLLEGVNPSAVDSFHRAGYNQVEYLKGALDHDELIEKIKDVHFIGIRSRTHLTDDVFDAAKKLCAVGCFCIGTNQVDLESASRHGIPVFNAPFSNTRSVTELVTGEYLMLLRRIPEKNANCHRGVWQKNAAGCFEARGKTLGIVGYGHIGTQVGIVAEALGLKGSDGTKLNISTQAKANAAMDVLDKAIQKALDQQTTIGAVQSRLSYTSSNLTTASENVQSSESTIRDADMAKEMTEYTKNNVLLQAAQSMLAQANQSSSSVLSLLQ